MFQRLTERARQVVTLAQQESRLHGHDSIGTGHLLMGLVLEDEGLAARVLADAGFTPERIRTELLKILPINSPPHSGQLPFTVQAVNLLERANKVMVDLDVNYVGTEHLLLAIIAEMLDPDYVGIEVEICVPGPTATVAGMILARCRADPRGLKMEIVNRLAGAGSRRPESASARPQMLKRGAVKLIVHDAEGDGFARIQPEAEFDLVYRQEWLRLPWAYVPPEFFVGGNSLKVTSELAIMDGSVEIHLDALETDQSQSWHSKMLEEGFSLVRE